MFSIMLALVVLGLVSIDPIGIAAMPVLLVQQRPLQRSATFLGSGFAALMFWGLLFAKGLGVRVLHFENSHSWLVPSVEIIAGLVLLGISAWLTWQSKANKLAVEPSGKLSRRLRLGNWKLFGLGMTIVSLQSVADVVFVIAMIRVGQLNLSNLKLGVAVASYAIAALLLQFIVVAAYQLTPPKQRDRTLARVHHLLTAYANQALILAGLLLGCGLLVIGLAS